MEGIKRPDPVAASKVPGILTILKRQRNYCRKRVQISVWKRMPVRCVLGIWIAEVSGLKDIADPAKVSSHLNLSLNTTSDLI